MTTPTPCITNKTYDEVNIGDSASMTRTLNKQDIQLFATVTGDMNPAHLDEAYAKTDIFHQIVGHGMWTGSMFSVLLGMQLPGPGTIYLNQTLKFLKPVHIGDTVTASVKAITKDDKHKRITFETLCVNQKGEHVVEGEALALAPSEKISWKVMPLPEVQMKTSTHNYQKWILDKISALKPVKVAVVHPVDRYSLEGAVQAAKASIIDPIFIGPEDKIRKAAADANIDISAYTIFPTLHSNAAADAAVNMANEGKVLLLDVPSYPKPLFLTDAAINIKPNLLEKRDIVQNAIDLFTTLKLGTPKVAILSAVETVTEKIPSTLDATALCKMAERGQITGGIIDGPLAFDNAISHEAAAIKGIESLVAGDADILVVPDIESGNMLYKELRYFSGVQGASIVLGAKVPIILTSRADDAENRVVSCALALLYARTKIL